MPAVTQGKNHRPKEVVFDNLTSLDFDPITLAASQVSTTIQAAIPVPANFKIFKVAANLTGSPAGTCSINVVAGVAAEGSVGTADGIAISGTKVFTSDTALTMTANTPAVIQATQFDAIYPTTLPLTVRAVTNGAGAGTLKVSLLGKFYDPNPQKGLVDASGNLTF